MTAMNPAMNAGSEDSEALKKQSSFKMMLKRLAANKLALTGGIIFIILVLISIFAPLIAPYDYLAVNPANKYAPASAQHLLGTDQFGRDIFSRLIWGGRWSLTLGVLGTVVSTFFGIVIGSIAGYFGGIVDTIIMRIIDIVQCIPGMLLTIMISVVLGQSFFATVAALSFGGIWGTARMLRGQILTVRTLDYVEAAKATNNKAGRIIFKYILPNSIQQTIIGACMGIGGQITMASGLSFLGLGVQPPDAEWGAMINSGRDFIFQDMSMIMLPSIAIFLIVLCVNVLGDSLRDALDLTTDQEDGI